MMFVHSPLSNKNNTPNVRRDSKSRKTKKHHANYNEGPGMIFSPNKGQGHSYVNNAKKKSSERSLKWPKVKPWKIILGSIVFGLIGLLYLTQIFQTQKIYQEVNKLERKYNGVKHTYIDTKYTYDRMIGPAEVYRKAKQMGLVTGGSANQVIIIKNP